MNFARIIILLASFCLCHAAIQDYIRGITKYFGVKNEHDDEGDLEGFNQRIPYEVSTIDEKFIAEAAKLTGVSLSELDKCQQRIVLRLKKGCHEMNDEDVSKMAVMLLNCQSSIEGRRIYPCTEEMSIKDCTTNMDADTWNTYHLMANRVRAVCYASRQSQFIGITENTINRLLETTRNQVVTLDKLVHEQENLKSIAKNTLDNVAQGNKEILGQQRDMAMAQFQGQLAVEDNIRRLFDEKKLISESHRELSEMTKNVETKLEEAARQLDSQSLKSNVNHKELLDDLVQIQQKTQEIFHRIDESSKLLVKQNDEAQKQYYSTLKQLSEVNSTVHSLVTLIYSTRQILEEKLSWISTALGGTDVAVDRLFLLTWHMSFVILGMITCAFLSCNNLVRLSVTVLPIANVTVGLYDMQMALHPFDLLLVLFSTLLVIYTAIGIVKLYGWKHNKLSILSSSNSPQQMVETSILYNEPKIKANDSPNSSFVERDMYLNKSFAYKGDSSVLERSTYEQEDTFSEFCAPTPPRSRNGHYDSRSRSRTPLTLNSTIKSPCKAITRLGTPCKINSTPGRDFCRRHERGDSVM